MHFSTNIKFLRELSGYTQKQLEEILNLKKGSYSAYESKSVYPRMPIILDLNDLFAQYYKGLTLDKFIRHDLRIEEEPSIEDLNEGKTDAIANLKTKDIGTMKILFSDKNIGKELMDKYIESIVYI